MLPFGCSHSSPMAFSSVVSVNHPLDLIPLDLFSWFYYEILENKLSTFFIPHQRNRILHFVHRYILASAPQTRFADALFFVYSTAILRPVDKLCPGKRLCRMEWEKARKKTPVGVSGRLVSSFLSLMRLRKGGSGLPLPLFLAGKAGPDCSPISARQMSPRSRSAVCAALFGTAGFPIHQYPPGSLSKNNCALCAWCGISQCTPSSPGRYRNPPFE